MSGGYGGASPMTLAELLVLLAGMQSQAPVTRVLDTIFRASLLRAAFVAYSVQITVTASISAGQNGDVILEIASDAGFSADVQTLAIFGSGQTYSLAPAVQGVQPLTATLCGIVPAAYYIRLRTVSNVGAPAFAYRAGQETLL